MLPTIPFKRSHAKTNKKHSHTSGSVGIASSTKNKTRVFKSPWAVILIVLGIAILGIVIIRYSRASNGVVNYVPQNLVDIQNYVSSLQVKSQETINVSGNAQFRYTPKTDQPVKLVGYYIDNQLYKTAKQAPYEVTINTFYLSNGTHTLTAVAFSNTDVPLSAKLQPINVVNNNDVLQASKNVITYPWHWLLNL